MNGKEPTPFKERLQDTGRQLGRQWQHRVATLRQRRLEKRLQEQGLTASRDASGGRSAASAHEMPGDYPPRLAPPARVSRQWFERLPDTNRRLLGSGLVCLGSGLFLLLGLPLLGTVLGAVQSAWSAATYPFSAEGRGQTCQSNLRRISLAMEQYRSDYDAHYPPIEYSRGGKRVTWVWLLGQRGVPSSAWQCPNARGGDGTITSAFALNPALASRTTEGTGEVASTLLIADRDDAHDLILLPPFGVWGARDSEAARQNNIAFRHGSETPMASILYADGHADLVAAGSWQNSPEPWGGKQLAQVTLERLQKTHPILTQLGSHQIALMMDAQALKKAMGALREVRTSYVQAQQTPPDLIEAPMWYAARALAVKGDDAEETQMNADLEEVLSPLAIAAQASLEGNESPTHQSEDGYRILLPAGWSAEREVDGRYRTTHLRSPSPYVEVMIERGERSTPSTREGIEWTGMEATLKSKYRDSYLQVDMGSGTLAEVPVSTWECSFQKADGPRLHKLYLGRSANWQSYIVVFTAPDAQWETWKPVFQKMIDAWQWNEGGGA